MKLLPEAFNLLLRSRPQRHWQSYTIFVCPVKRKGIHRRYIFPPCAPTGMSTQSVSCLVVKVPVSQSLALCAAEKT